MGTTGTVIQFLTASSLLVSLPVSAWGDLAAVAVKIKFSVGDGLGLMTPQGNINITLEHMENAKGEAMPVAPGDGYTISGSRSRRILS